VESILIQEEGFLCSEPVHAYLLMENIIGRLDKFQRCFTFPQTLYILIAAAGGYNTLNSFFGPLEPNE
jgi:hypothetical protein